MRDGVASPPKRAPKGRAAAEFRGRIGGQAGGAVANAPSCCTERHMKDGRVKPKPQIFHDRAVSSSRSRNWSTSPASLAVIDT